MFMGDDANNVGNAEGTNHVEGRMATAARRSKTRQEPLTRTTPPKQTATRKGGLNPIPMTPVRKLRNRLYLKQPQFARLLGMSVRTLAALEGGSAPTESIARRMTEIERLTNALAEVVEKTSIGEWLQKPNPAFDGLKPLEVIERGEGDRLWQMIYYLRSGTAS